MTNNEFRCADCGEVFIKGWSDEEALIEAIMEFPNMALNEPLVAVCSDCYERILRFIEDEDE